MKSVKLQYNDYKLSSYYKVKRKTANLGKNEVYTFVIINYNIKRKSLTVAV